MANSRWQTNQYYLYLACACAAGVSVTRLVSMIMFLQDLRCSAPQARVCNLALHLQRFLGHIAHVH